MSAKHTQRLTLRGTFRRFQLWLLVIWCDYSTQEEVKSQPLQLFWLLLWQQALSFLLLNMKWLYTFESQIISTDSLNEQNKSLVERERLFSCGFPFQEALVVFICIKVENVVEIESDFYLFLESSFPLFVRKSFLTHPTKREWRVKGSSKKDVEQENSRMKVCNLLLILRHFFPISRWEDPSPFPSIVVRMWFVFPLLLCPLLYSICLWWCTSLRSLFSGRSMMTHRERKSVFYHCCSKGTQSSAKLNNRYRRLQQRCLLWERL